MHYRKWNKLKINEQLKVLKNAYYDNPSQENALALKAIYDLINNKPNMLSPKDRFDTQIRKDIDIVQSHSAFIPHIKEFISLDDGFNTKLLPPLNEYNFPNRVLLSFVHDFYNSFDRDIAKAFNRIFKERHNNLRITTKPKHGYNRQYTIFLNTLKYAYINIYRTDTVLDFINLVHEYAHTIADQIRYRSNYDKYPFIELFPMLMQEIAYDEIVRCLDDLDEEVMISDAYTTKTCLKYAKEIVLQGDYLSTSKICERKQFISDMAQYTNNTKSKTGKILNISLHEKISYVIPFLVMIELYDMYYQDQEKAIYTTKRLITMDENEDYIKYLESLGININEHSEQYVEAQKKKLRLTNLM